MHPLLNEYSGKKILITGHTGFKGAWLSRILVLAGAQVYGVSLDPEPGSLFSRISDFGIKESSIIDIRNRSAINRYFEKHRFDGVFHLAAQPLVRRSYREPVETFETNVMGTANLLDAIVKNKAALWCIVITTDKVYKNQERSSGYLEDDALGGKDPYSASKAAVEMVVSAWQTLSMDGEGIKIHSARAGNVIGGGDVAEDRLLPDLVRGFIGEKTTVIRNPNSIRPWQHVLDPLSGYLEMGLRLMANKKLSNAFNFGPTEESKLTVKEMAAQACTFWPGNKGIEVKIDQTAPPETGLLWLSSDLAGSELGWKNQLKAKDAIDWTIKWERESMQNSPLVAMDNQIKEFFMVSK